MAHADRLRLGRLAETEIQLPPSTSEDRVLSRLNQNFRLSKAQQILRLLRDQDDLNQRFRDCALVEEEEAGDGREEDTWSVQEETRSDDSDTSEHEAERRAARRVALRKHRNSIDPGRCKTSMGFYNEAEVTEIPYDTDSDAVAGLDSACSTPRGGALSARQPAPHPGLLGPGPGANSRLRLYQLQVNDVEGEDCVVQSARSSRPKTSLAQPANRGRYYRQQPHPETRGKSGRHPHPVLSHPGRPMQGPLGDTRQAIISRLDPHHPLAVRPFCEVKAVAGDDPPPSPRTLAPSSQPSTPRGGFSHTEVTLFDMAPSPGRSSRRPANGCNHNGGGLSRSTSFADHPHHPNHRRALLSVDSSTLQLGDVSPRARPSGVDESPSSRRQRPSRVKKRVGTVSTSMHVLSERASPALTVMKLPPLETAVPKGSPGGSGRDLVCVGKD